MEEDDENDEVHDVDGTMHVFIGVVYGFMGFFRWDFKRTQNQERLEVFVYDVSNLWVDGFAIGYFL